MRLFPVIFAFVVTCIRVHLCEANDVIWTRDTSFDGVVKTLVKKAGFPYVLYTEVPGKTVSASAWAVHCTRNTSCSSFFFLPATGGCVLHKGVLARPNGGQVSPGAMYFKAVIGCPRRDGYVWVRDQKTCFKFYDGSYTFNQAYTRCAAANRELISLSTRDKDQAVAAYVMDACGSILQAAYVQNLLL